MALICRMQVPAYSRNWEKPGKLSLLCVMGHVRQGNGTKKGRWLALHFTEMGGRWLGDLHSASYHMIPTHTGQKYKRIVRKKSLFSILCSSSTQTFNIWDWTAGSFLSVDVLSSITWMPLYTETLCWLLSYSEILAPTTQKTSVALVLFSAVQRIHAGSLQRGPFFSHLYSSSVASGITH